MPVPPLNAHGHLPPGIHDVSLEDFRIAFASTPYRNNLYVKFHDFLEWVKASNAVKRIYLDGSFTTSKDIPSDVDIVLELPDAQTYSSLRSLFAQFLNVDSVKKLFSVHPFSVLNGQTIGFVDFFQRLKAEELSAKKLPPVYRKGILRITL